LQVKKPTVFVANFSGDTFHEKVPRRTILGIWRVMEVCPQHTFIVLTKRWTRMYGLVRDLFEGRRGFPLSNVWLGVSVSTQAELNAAEPYLLKTPAVVRFLSLEPLLGPVDLVGVRRAFIAEACGCTEIDVDWVIVGCESGPNRRPCPIEYVESVVAQCKAAGVPVFVKQVSINGRVSKDVAEWPESIRVRELPE
jgi:protein gp37